MVLRRPGETVRLTLQERFPPAESHPESGPLYDVWAHIFDAITAAEHGSARQQRALFMKRMEATQRVWGVVEPLLREVAQILDCEECHTQMVVAQDTTRDISKRTGWMIWLEDDQWHYLCRGCADLRGDDDD